jgi:AcrR family transcriptional regulator
MGRASPATASRRRDRRLQEVLQAASDVFAEKGFFAATTRDIADRLQMLPGSLYYYIASKEDALRQICEQVGARYLRAMQELLAAPGPVTALVERGILAHLRSNRTELVFAFAIGSHELPPALRADLARLSRRYQKQWQELLARGVAAGELHADLDCGTAAVAILAMCNGAIGWYGRKSERELGDVAAAFARLVLQGIAAARTPAHDRPGA